MDITNSLDVDSLPDGVVVITKDGRDAVVHVDTKWAFEAAQALTKANYPLAHAKTFSTKAEIIAEAINSLKWSGIGQQGFQAQAKTSMQHLDLG